MAFATPAADGGQSGFSLLEGLVAIALLAGTLVAIFTLVGSILGSAHRIGRSNDSVEVTLNAIEAMSVVNPMIQDSGRIDLGPYQLYWKSAAITQVTDGTGYPAGISNYRVALYESDVEVAEPAGSVLTTFKLRQVGYRRVRDTLPPVSAGTP
jgi:Tfp pilus assembly protein PilV